MDITIIDESDEQVRMEENKRLLWIAALISEWTNVANYSAMIMYLRMDYNRMSERNKFNMYVNWIKGNPNFTADNISESETAFATIVASRKRKGKGKEVIVALHHLEKWLQQCFKDFETFFHALCSEQKTAELLPLTGTNSIEREQPVLVWHFPKADSEQHAQARIKGIGSSVCSEDCIPFFDNSVNKNLLVTSMARAEKGGFISKLGDVLCDYLFEIPEPFSLITSQILMVRSDFSKTTWKFFDEAVKCFDDLKKIPFTHENFSRIALLYHQRLAGFIPSMQKTAEENECFIQLKKENPEIKFLKVHCGITSFSTIITFYKNFGIIDESEVLYIREEISADADVNNARLFLFLES